MRWLLLTGIAGASVSTATPSGDEIATFREISLNQTLAPLARAMGVARKRATGSSAAVFDMVAERYIAARSDHWTLSDASFACEARPETQQTFDRQKVRAAVRVNAAGLLELMVFNADGSPRESVVFVEEARLPQFH